MTSSDPNPSLIESVLRLSPRLAVFDCDGTLWSGDAGEGFFDWELKRGIVSQETASRMRARYAEYRAGKVYEDDMCGEMVTMHKGMAEAEVLALAREYFAEKFVGRIFGEMKRLVAELQASGCEVWAVSSTNEWVIREAMAHVGIDPAKILAAAVEIENGVVTDTAGASAVGDWETAGDSGGDWTASGCGVWEFEVGHRDAGDFAVCDCSESESGFGTGGAG